MKLIICEKPSVAKSVSSALGAKSRADGFITLVLKAAKQPLTTARSAGEIKA